MKCAKEVMEQWKVSTEKMYSENLMKMVDVVTERLFKQASNGMRTTIPRILVSTYPIKDGPENARMVYITNKKEAIPLKWNEFELALKMLCYGVKPIYPDSEAYFVTPNPSC